jgi:aspartyl-tRNA(Asn)/glutamyl-tRNA(Gln) amidotransferase subunit B
LAALIETVRKGQLTTSRAREVFAEMLVCGKSLEETMQSMGIAAVDESELEHLCRELLAANPKVVAEVKEGKPKGLGQLIGQAKKKNPNVNPNRFRELCEQLIQRGVV